MELRRWRGSLPLPSPAPDNGFWICYRNGMSVRDALRAGHEARTPVRDSGLAIGSLRAPAASIVPRPAPTATSSRLDVGVPGAVLDVRAVGPNIRVFRVRRPPGFAFEAGQSLRIGLAHAPVRRRYSIASAPHDEHLEFCIESVPGGQLTSLLFELSAGAQLALGAKAKGSFALRSDRQTHVMVATGTGIAPLRSMLRSALSRAASLRAAPLREPAAHSRAPQFWVLHGASYADELPYADELAALARSDPRVHYLPTVSRPHAQRNRGWTGQQGRVDRLVLPTLRALGPKHGIAVYACGHSEMVRAVRQRLEPLGYLVVDESFD
jgi:ferredoxin-NADP reductase